MYQALYRKYRPKTFSDVIGQPYVTGTLKNEIKLGRVGHAYLFIGSRGTGKTSCAKIFSKAVNCENNISGDPCGSCGMCISIDSAEVMDIVELDAASNNGVDDIREICESAAFTPARAKYRVYIIDEVHMLSIGAFNALLKTLEEPPAHVIFILATTEAHKVPATILSRCQRFEFNRISKEDIGKRLLYVADCEDVTLEQEAAMLIARISDGAMRDALAILDKCISDEGNVTVDVVTRIIGIASKEYIYQLGSKIAEKNASDALNIISKLSDESKDMKRLCDELVGYFRNVMLIKVTNNAEGIISISKEEYENASEVAEKLEVSDVVNILDNLENTIERVSKGCDSRTEIEIAIVKLCNPQLKDNVELLLSRVEKLEHAVESSIQVGVECVKDSPKFDSTSITSSVQLPMKKDKFSEEVRQDEPTVSEPCEHDTVEHHKSTTNLQNNAREMTNWSEILEALKGQSRTMAMAFKGSKAYINGDFVLIDSRNDVAFELLRKSAQRDRLRTIIKEITGKSYKLGPYKSSDTVRNADPLDGLLQMAMDSGIQVEKD